MRQLKTAQHLALVHSHLPRLDCAWSSTLASSAVPLRSCSTPSYASLHGGACVGPW